MRNRNPKNIMKTSFKVKIRQHAFFNPTLQGQGSLTGKLKFCLPKYKLHGGKVVVRVLTRRVQDFQVWGFSLPLK